MPPYYSPDGFLKSRNALRSWQEVKPLACREVLPSRTLAVIHGPADNILLDRLCF